MNCYECNERMEIIKDQPYHYDTCGLDNVVIYGVPQYKCPNCGEFYVSILKLKQLHQLIGMNLCCQEEKLSGNEIRYLRKELRLKGLDFASILSVAPSTLSRYENDKESPSESTDKLIRLAYIHMVDIREDVADMVDWRQMLRTIARRPANPKKEIKINPGEWIDKLMPTCIGSAECTV